MPDPEAARENLRKPMPVGRKVKLVVRNSFLKLRKPRGCCGHPGEPGC